MPQYRKKPVIITAVQFNGSLESLKEIACDIQQPDKISACLCSTAVREINKESRENWLTGWLPYHKYTTDQLVHSKTFEVGMYCGIRVLEINDDDTRYYSDVGYLIIDTIEGKMLAHRGWYVIKGVEGEIYSCAPNIFTQTYEAI